MKPWVQNVLSVREKEIERELPKLQPDFMAFQCLFGPHRAELLHRGTAYCRSHYDEKNRLGQLLDP